MQRRRDLNDGSATIVTVSAPTSPAPLHRRPRTDQHLLSAAPEAPPLTEMVFGSSERVLPCLNAQAVTSTALGPRACMEKERGDIAVNLSSVHKGRALAGPNV